VLHWGELHRRALPWRETRDPWRVLVSEVMLQQTQVSRVVGPYRHFVDRFPDPAACAASPVAEVVRAWAGLGYNRRAVRLHRAAALMVQRHGGRVPADRASLLALPGVGPYTARAVQAFALGVDTGVVDVNVGRLLARAVLGAPLGTAGAQELADRLVPPGRAWEFNQALFDIGSGFCRARPDCAPCPLLRRCAWRRAGRAASDPARGSAATGRRQSAFDGSDRQGRGRLVRALLAQSVRADQVAAAAGWPDDPERAGRVTRALVAEGLVRERADGALELA
jgi:A/G-specific adenine glycosylase